MASKQGIQVGGRGGQIAGIPALQPGYDIPGITSGFRVEILPVQIVAADGRNRATREIGLPANALVKRYDLVITATRAERVAAADVADLREASSPGGKPAVVVDFGVPRTVNEILLPQSGSYTVYPWLGMAFDARSGMTIDSATRVALSGTDGSTSTNLYKYDMPETRGERLLIEPEDGETDLVNLMAKLWLSLPELPADLTLRINGDAPVWQHPGTVQPSETNELNDSNWTRDGRRRVSIAAALADYSGDATRPESQTLTLELSSSVPGKLSIEIDKQELQLLNRLGFNAGDPVLEFPAEGRQQLALQTPPGAAGPRALRGLRLTLSGELPPGRALPPLGPDAGGIGELVLGNGRAACARLDGGGELIELTGVRLPLSVSAGSAEARVMLWRDAGGTPVEALADAASEPVSMDNQGEAWISFPFSEPVPFDASAPPWAALIVSRGELVWSLAAGNAAGDHPLRIGAPEGPWRALPAIFGSGLDAVAGRLRLLGLAADTQPLAPLRLALGNSDTQPVTPSANGLRLQLAAPASTGAGATQLLITSYTAGTVTLSEIDAITDA